MRIVPAVLVGLLFALAAGISGCAGYAGRGLVAGVADHAQVVSVMGQPAMRWQEADGSLQLAYPRGPEGPHTFMVRLAADGRLSAIGNVLDEAHFAQIVTGMDKDQVLRILGPSTPQWTSYFKARDELVWEWLYCDSGGFLARFDVLFDGAGGRVRTTYSRPDYRGPDGAVPSCGGLPPRE